MRLVFKHIGAMAVFHTHANRWKELITERNGGGRLGQTSFGKSHERR
jgi:hypothetical protein